MNELRFFFNKLPFNIILYPTSRCNAKCPHCYNAGRSSASQDSELSLDEISKISGKFEHIKVLTISGGEPFIRNDIAEIAEIFYKNNGLQYLSIHTNGFFSKKIADTVLNILNLYSQLKVIICISIDGTEEKHDSIRGLNNGFKKIIETINLLEQIKNKYGNLYLVSSSIFSKSTQDSIEETVDYIYDNFKIIKPSLSLIRGDSADLNEKEIDIDKYLNFYKNKSVISDNSITPFSLMSFKDAIENLTHKYAAANYLKQIQTLTCRAGTKLIVIYENGDVYPCELYPEKIGNLRAADYDIKKILNTEKCRNILKNIAAGKCHCSWENIIPINLIFDFRKYPEILWAWLKTNFDLLENKF